MIIDIHKDNTYIVRKYTHDDLYILGELFRNCLNDPGHSETHEKLRKEGVFAIFKKGPGKTKYKRWVCASFTNDEIKGFGNIKLSVEEFLEVWKVYSRFIEPNDREYSILYRLANWFYNADDTEIDHTIEHFDEMTTDDISTLLAMGAFDPDDEDLEDFILE